MADLAVADALNRLYSMANESALEIKPRSKTSDFASQLQGGAPPHSPAVDPRIEQLKSELRERLDGLPAVDSEKLIDSQERMKLLQQALTDIDPPSKIATSNLTQLEVDWRDIQTLIASSKNLSQHDLLILQARLYQLSEQIQLLSKVVEQLTGGVKTVMHTNA
jgi:hypothetical protein